MIRLSAFESRIMEQIKDLFFKDYLYENDEKKIYTLKMLLQKIEFESYYSFKFF